MISLFSVVVPTTRQSTLPTTQETAAKNTAIIISGIIGCVVGVIASTATMLAVRFLRRRNGYVGNLFLNRNRYILYIEEGF